MKQIWNRLQLMIGHGVATLVSADKLQVKVLDGEVLNNVRRVEPYGFSSRPLAGCQAYIVFPSGDRSYGVALVVGDKQYQMDLVGGEVALHDDQGNYVAIKRDGNIEVKASTKVLIDSPLVETKQNLKVGGDVEIVGGLTVNGKNVSDTHTHTSAAAGSPTSGVN